MLGIGLPEVLLIALVLLFVVGPERLPGFMRTAGRTYGKVRRAADEMRRAFVLEADRIDLEERQAERDERRRRAEAERLAALERAGLGAVPQVQAAPAAPRQVAPVAPVDAEAPPDGISSEEWRELPEHIRGMLRGKSGGGQG